jgi:hypothetical protein
MRNRRRHDNDAVGRLRLAIDCMPVATREAMLRGVRSSERVIIGAYVDDRGGTCPMLAAHRCGGRTDFLTFAKSWDRFTRAKLGRRVATARELRILLTQLEESLSQSSGLELDQAIREHRALRGRRLRSRRAQRQLLDSADPTGEIVVRRKRWSLRRNLGGGNSADETPRRAPSPVS